MAGHTAGLGVWAALLALLASGCGFFEGKAAPAPLITADAVAGNNSGGASGGAAGSGEASGASGTAGAAGQAWVSPVAPEVSQHWTWQECGRISPDVADELRYDGRNPIISLALSADGSFLVSNAYRIIGWQVASAFGDSQPLWRTGGAEGGTNVALSPDGRLGSVSGDVRLIFDAATGETLFFEGAIEIGPLPEFPCFGTEFNFSPDSRLVAGKHYATTVSVIDTNDFQPVGYFPTVGCGQGLVFSADGQAITTPDATASLDQLTPAPPPTTVLSQRPPEWISLTRAPDGSVRQVVCTGTECRSSGFLPTKTGGSHLSVSAEGQWFVLGGQLRHEPSDELRVLDEQATEAVFAPNGDIIVGETDASLVRFCRTD